MKLILKIWLIITSALTNLNFNKMATKTWKLGEVARGGVITAEVTKGKVTVIAKDWDFSTGSRKSSNQSNAKELYRLEVSTDGNDIDMQREITIWLQEEATSYWADEILKWILSKMDRKKRMFW
jgi:Tfp pilus assembly protein PilV